MNLEPNTTADLSDEQKKELNIVDENFKKIEEIVDDQEKEDEDEDEDEELFFEPEDCEYCKELAEASGIEYTQEYHAEGGVAICDGCGRPM